MVNRTITISLVSFFVLLIVFDAAQQKYYIETFDLNQTDEVLTLAFLIKQHFIRWLIWSVVCIPICFFIWKELPKDHNSPSAKSIVKMGIVIIVGICISIISISFQSILFQDLPISAEILTEFAIFFTFQKGLTFLLAFLTASLILFHLSRQRTVESQLIEIRNLTRKSTDLEQALNESSDEPYLNIKTGYKIQPIPVSEIIWIQSDDYCVKIHTNDKAFTLRKSMKALEEQLTPYGFIRVHRIALLNLNFLHQIDFDTSRIKLTTTDELPLSKTGAKVLKKQLEKVAL